METGNAQDWIDRLGLKPHPEGGFYHEVFRSGLTVHREETTAARTACTSIYYLLAGEDYSGFHRLASDEIWYFHAGDPLRIHWLDKNGRPAFHTLSPLSGHTLTVAMPAGTWFAAEIPGRKGFALCSCAVAPGFEFSEFEMGVKADLLDLYPGAAELIGKFCR